MTDTRVTCTTCRNLRAGWCVEAKRAGLPVLGERTEIGTALANLPQHCPAYTQRQNVIQKEAACLT